MTIVFFATAAFACAQKPDTPPVNENMLRYRYVDKAYRKVDFKEHRGFAERAYLVFGTGAEWLYQLGNHPKSPGYAIGSQIGMGYWATPLHGFELSLNYGMMPHGYWGNNFLGNPVIKNTIIKNIGFELDDLLIKTLIDI